MGKKWFTIHELGAKLDAERVARGLKPITPEEANAFWDEWVKSHPDPDPKDFVFKDPKRGIRRP
jgi:hypothetical protein